MISSAEIDLEPIFAHADSAIAEPVSVTKKARLPKT